MIQLNIFDELIERNAYSILYLLNEVIAKAMAEKWGDYILNKEKLNLNLK